MKYKSLAVGFLSGIIAASILESGYDVDNIHIGLQCNPGSFPLDQKAYFNPKEHSCFIDTRESHSIFGKELFGQTYRTAYNMTEEHEVVSGPLDEETKSINDYSRNLVLKLKQYGLWNFYEKKEEIVSKLPEDYIFTK